MSAGRIDSVVLGGLELHGGEPFIVANPVEIAVKVSLLPNRFYVLAYYLIDASNNRKLIFFAYNYNNIGLPWSQLGENILRNPGRGQNQRLMVLLLLQSDYLPQNDANILGQGRRETLDLLTYPSLATLLRLGDVEAKRIDDKSINIIFV